MGSTYAKSMKSNPNNSNSNNTNTSQIEENAAEYDVFHANHENHDMQSSVMIVEKNQNYDNIKNEKLFQILSIHI